MNLIELTRTLIDIPSPTGDETAVSDFLQSYLKSLGYQVEQQDVERGRQNVIATTSRRPRVVLSTHMDTVPPHIAFSEDKEFIFGRGACDAKGIIAAQVMAAQLLRAEGVDEIGLLFTVDEEAGSEGATAANKHSVAELCEFLINGEPTDNKLAIGSKGSLRLRLIVEGRAAHSAYPEYGDSAIEKLLDVLSDLRTFAWPVDEFFGETTCNIGTIGGGTRANVVPAYAEAVLQIRLVTDAAKVKTLLQEVVNERGRIDYLSECEPMRMFALDGLQHCIVRFTTDIPHLNNWGAPLLLGPGSILDAHTMHERIAKRELTDAVDLYVQLARTLLNTAPRRVAEGAT